MPDSPSRCEIGIQTGDINRPLRRTTDFGVNALGVFRDAPVVLGPDNIRRMVTSSPAIVTLPYVPEDSKNLLEDVSCIPSTGNVV